MSKTLEQQRAVYALTIIKRQNSEEYGRHVKKLPAMILNNGLGQALAFLLADDEGNHNKASYRLYSDLNAWLCKKEHPRCIYENGILIDSLMNGDRSQYMQAQEEALKLLVWLKKFADAYLLKSVGE